MEAKAVLRKDRGGAWVIIALIVLVVTIGLIFPTLSIVLEGIFAEVTNAENWYGGTIPDYVTQAVETARNIWSNFPGYALLIGIIAITAYIFVVEVAGKR